MLVLFLLSINVYASRCNGYRALVLSTEMLDRLSEINDEYPATLDEISESESAFVFRRTADDPGLELWLEPEYARTGMGLPERGDEERACPGTSYKAVDRRLGASRGFARPVLLN